MERGRWLEIERSMRKAENGSPLKDFEDVGNLAFELYGECKDLRAHVKRLAGALQLSRDFIIPATPCPKVGEVLEASLAALRAKDLWKKLCDR